LLILSIAIPTSATKHESVVGVKSESNVDSKLLHDCEESLLDLRSLLYLQASQTVASLPFDRMSSDAFSEVIHRLRDHLETIEPLCVSSTIDSVTKLASRGDLEKLLTATAKWAPLVEVSTQVALIQVDNLDELDDQHGPMASELMLREAASFLRDRIGGIGPLARFNHCGFVVALHGWQQATAVELLESVRREFQQLSVTIGDATISTTASASVTSLDLTSSFDANWERLEDGMAEAITNGANRGRWYDSTDSLWRPMGDEVQNQNEHSSSVSSEISPTVSADDLDGAAGEPQSEEDTAASDASLSSETAASTITKPAVENAHEAKGEEAAGLKADDIASLFKAAQSNKPAKPAATTSTAPTPLAAKIEPTSEEPESPNDIQDDIAALFKAARAFKAPAANADSDGTPAKPTKKPAEEPEEAAPAATNDDIESLFAAFRKTK
jgi:diguanylate cyclase (GGDEF)-like protein